MSESMCPGTYRGQKKVLDPLKLNFQALWATSTGTGIWTWVLLKSNKVFNHWAISSATKHSLEPTMYILPQSYLSVKHWWEAQSKHCTENCIIFLLLLVISTFSFLFCFVFVCFVFWFFVFVVFTCLFVCLVSFWGCILTLHPPASDFRMFGLQTCDITSSWS